jgi:hypothetical protein
VQVAAVEACQHCTLCRRQGTAHHNHHHLLLLLARLLHLLPRAALCADSNSSSTRIAER